MNKTKIETFDYTWNPITGCKTGCSWCYARRIATRFQGHFNPTFHPERLDEPAKLKKPSRIFVVSMGDMFGPWVPKEWVEDIFRSCDKAPHHTYFFLTKYPANAKYHVGDYGNVRSNWWIGTTIIDENEEHKALDLPFFWKRFISFEPLRGSPRICFGVDWLIIGAMTGQGAKKYQPKLEWVQSLVKQAREANIPVFMKASLKGIYPEKLIQETP